DREPLSEPRPATGTRSPPARLPSGRWIRRCGTGFRLCNRGTGQIARNAPPKRVPHGTVIALTSAGLGRRRVVGWSILGGARLLQRDGSGRHRRPAIRLPLRSLIVPRPARIGGSGGHGDGKGCGL